MKKLFKVLGTFLHRPTTLYYYIQKSIRHPKLRHWLARSIASLSPEAQALVSDSIQQKYALLDRDGYVDFSELISAEQVQAINNYLGPKECVELRHAAQTRVRVSEGVPKSCRKLFYEHETLVNCPHVLDIANHPQILATVEKHLGCRPTISFLTAWWSFPGEPEAGEELYDDDMFHRDVEDFSFLKLFIYLTDVVDENGPHIFVKGTHKSENLVRRGLISDDEFAQYFAQENIVKFEAPAGTAFLENTWGIHRASPVKAGSRLILQVQYSLKGVTPWAPKEPVASLQNSKFDKYTNRVYLK